MYKRILIATDGSELSQKAVASGIGLAASLGAEVVAFTAVPRYPDTYFEGALILTSQETDRIEEQWRKAAQKLVDAVQEDAQCRHVNAEAVVGTGTASDSIINAAKTHGCDLIVMASHGRKGVKRVLLGSETLAVLTHSDVPVLVLR